MKTKVITLFVVAFLLSACGAVGTSTETASPASGAATSEPTHAVVGPEPGATWQLQYAGELPETGGDAREIAQIWDVDGADTSAEWVADANAAGIYTICYFNAGGWEDWREDAGEFSETLIGSPLDGWEGENWLDIRQVDQLLPIMEARMDECAAKGFDAVDPDNLDGYANDPGFPLTQADSVAYLQALAQAAHERGLAIGLKNALATIPELVDTVDFAVNEECVAYQECDSYQPFLDAGKAVLHVEYDVTLEEMCAQTPDGFSSLLTDLDLSESGQRCEQ